MDTNVINLPVKKKIAVFANAYNTDNLYGYMKGLSAGFSANTADFFLFMTQSLYSNSDTENKSLNTIFDLPDLSTFDAAVIYTPGLNFPSLIEKLVVRLSESNIPTVSVGLKYKGFHSITIDNYIGMKDLCDHLIDEHNVSDVLFVAGSKDNADSNIRLQALKDSMANHNLPFGEENILYTNWEVGVLLRYIYDMIDNNLHVPQAFICANDLLAETITYAMEDRDYPDYEKQIITGFDYMEETQAFFPSLASVDQQPYEQGKQSAHIITEMLNTGTAPDNINVACRFCPGESCGCINTRDEEKLRQKIARSTPRKFMEDNFVDHLFNSIANEMIHCDNFNTMKLKLQNSFYSSDGREGDTFYIILDHYLVNSPVSEEFTQYEKYKFSDKMDTIVAKYESKGIPVETFPTHEILPGYTGVGRNHIYMFTPLFYKSYVCGYIVFTDKLAWIKRSKFMDLSSVLKNAFITHRRNMELKTLNAKLSALMERDSLTSVKNRTAYDNYVKELEKNILFKRSQPFSVLCFDINNLKEINDNLGHEMGDEYIRNCCKYICDYFKKSPVYRIGGDEFVTVLFDEDYNNREELLRKMRKGMTEIIQSGDDIPKVNRISIATGMADYDPTTNDTYSDIFKWADEKMYQHKHIMKNGHIR